MCQDWANLLVAVLSILVTILIGWQIYTAIDIKKTIKELKSRTNKQYEDALARAYTSIMNQTSYVVEGREEDDKCYNAIANALFASKHYYLAGKREESERMLSLICSLKKEHCSFSKKNINDLRQIIGQVEERGVKVQRVKDWIDEYEKQ